MTTPRDLLIVAMDTDTGRSPERGDLALALAGGELIDLLSAQAVTLDGDRLVPSPPPAVTDHLLETAASTVAAEAPYESVGDWLWRRGRGLTETYLAAFDAEGLLTRQRRHRWMPFSAGQTVLADSPARRSAADRYSSREPVLTALAAAVGLDDEPGQDAPDVEDDAVATVLAAVHDALRELDAERQRRAVEEAAADNIRRGQ
ncbi:GPP34 family phosphoprotein [Streptomyces sp. FIT100]|uniref:GOLPH3/VPS74 family protein n=1 Tax=Streptomyces sp. FIT100 TaxID=2837956 RepID=UPI0021C6135B|nr:GPP34 family phosphoprotein [Streptomyces sp. FIT100]UUN27351.1 GPP34 family phosphoprotein [Streptomyces sp. FIT100]